MEYKKVVDQNNKLSIKLENIIIYQLSSEKANIEKLMEIVATNDFPTDKSAPNAAYSNLAVANEAVRTLWQLRQEPEEIGVLSSLHYTFDSLGTFLSQIDTYYGYHNQQPFNLINCASGSIRSEEDIYNELNNFLDIFSYTDKENPEWKDLISGWEVGNGYDCNF